MDAKARRALRVIQRCVAAERYVVLPHFTQRMHRRGFFWPDVLTIIDKPAAVRFDGLDRHGWAAQVDRCGPDDGRAGRGIGVRD